MNYSLSIPKEESATSVPGEKPMWTNISEDLLHEALEFCREQILNDKKNDLVVKAFGKNLTEDVLEKWIKESGVSNDGKVNYHDFLRKMSQNKKKQTENLLYAEM